MRSFAIPILASSFAASFASAQAAPRPNFGALDRLVGTWTADSGSGGQPGTALRGGETWSRDLDNRVIVRRDFSEYAATSTRPAWRHEGFMVIGPAAAGGFAAHMYDNEGHVIDYSITMSDSAVMLTSPAIESTPQFRLTYRPSPTGYAVQFEIAPPGQPGVFRSYVSGGMHRTP